MVFPFNVTLVCTHTIVPIDYCPKETLIQKCFNIFIIIIKHVCRLDSLENFNINERLVIKFCQNIVMKNYYIDKMEC